MALKPKKEIIEAFGKNAQDTGSAEVQVALLTVIWLLTWKHILKMFTQE